MCASTVPVLQLQSQSGGTIKALETRIDMAGSSQARLFRCSDGYSYVVKFANNPFGPRILINELVCTRLARLLGLPVPEGRVITVDDTVEGRGRLKIRHDTYSVDCKLGACFGSRYPCQPDCAEPTYCLGPYEILSHLRNVADFAGTLMFDIWTSNMDQRQATFLRSAHSIYYDAYMIDFGFCFNGSSWTLPFKPKQALHRTRTVYHWITNIKSFEPWFAKLENLRKQDVLAAASDLPDEWFNDDRSALNSLLEKVDERRSEVARMLMGFMEATPGVFPSLKRRCWIVTGDGA